MAKMRTDEFSPSQQQELRRILSEFLEKASQEGLLKRAAIDLLTSSEEVMLGRRVQIAKKLLEGKSGTAICRELRIGQTTVERVDQWLRRQWPEYRHLLLRKRREDPKDEDPLSFRNLRRRFPLHFLLWNLVLQDIDWSKPRKSAKRIS